MSFSEFETKRIEKALNAFLSKRRPKPHLRDQLDFGYEIHNQNVFINEIRPDWQNPEEIHHRPFARATWVKSRKVWKIYWMRQTLEWDRYDPVPEVKSIEDFCDIVNEDEYHCFFG